MTPQNTAVTQVIMQSTITQTPTDRSHTAPYLTRLNPPQREAVTTTEGPLLVLSGAGTGKTSVLTARIAHLLHERLAWPSEILAVTFTNKAAREMVQRVGSILTLPPRGGVEERSDSVGGNELPASPPTKSSNEDLTPPRGGSGTVLPFLGTFHSISAKILRRHAEMIGFSSDYIILDTDDQTRLIKTILQERNIDVKQNPPKQFLWNIQNWKDKGLVPEKVSKAEKMMTGGPQVHEIYIEYQRRLKAMNCMDFGDLLLHCLTLFNTHPNILQQYAQRFKYIMIDEYQDTNIAQYLWLRLLALGHKNICCVGDDDQSIYGWRGAEVGNILKFEKDFPGAKVIKLEQNYRSTPQILAAASHLIGYNDTRLGKTLWTEAQAGEKLQLQTSSDSEEEAYNLGEKIEHLRRHEVPYSEMAILVRAGFQTRQFEERLLTLGLPYQVIGGQRFYERAEIRDIIAYLRVVQTPADNLAFERIINTPKRGVGKATLEKIHSAGREWNVSMFKALERLLGVSPLPMGEVAERNDAGEGPLPKSEISTSPGGRGVRMKGKVADSLTHLLNQFARWRGLLGTLPIGELTDMILDESGYRAMWEKEKNAEANGRLENLRELIRAMGEFEDLTAFLEHVGLVTDIAEANRGNDGEMVTLMTLHAAKGLEFDCVFLPGWEEGLFPHQRSIDESGKEGLEEERRLAYVGITRARKRVFISHAERRRFFTKGGIEWQPTVPSRFITELPPEHVESQDAYSRQNYNRFNQARNDFADEMATIMEGAGGSFGGFPTASRQPSAVSHQRDAFSPGAKVSHPKFGEGIVIKKEEDTLEIAFNGGMTKRIMSEFVTLV